MFKSIFADNFLCYFKSFQSSICRQKELKLKCFFNFKILIQSRTNPGLSWPSFEQLGPGCYEAGLARMQPAFVWTSTKNKWYAQKAIWARSFLPSISCENKAKRIQCLGKCVLTSDQKPESPPHCLTVEDYLLYVSGKLSTYPSPKPTLTLTSHLGQNVGLREG